MTQLKFIFFVVSIFLSQYVVADDLQVVGSIDQTIPLNPLTYSKSLNSETKHIKLIEYNLTTKTRDAIKEKVHHDLQKMNEQTVVNSSKTKAVQLGMNKVPVLDQGKNGTCATFAITAAIDAILQKGDYVSQLCLLQLGNYLENQGAGPSGWDGSSGSIVLNRISKYGIINLNNQKKYGCGGLTEYPYYSSSSNQMMPEQYAEHIEDIKSTGMTWTKLFSFYSPNKASNPVLKVKAILDKGDRVPFAVLLPGKNHGVVGAVGWHHYLDDTWVLSYAIEQELQSGKVFPGHEMIITGYDDNAIAMDGYGHRHHGLLTLRNSWGIYVADWGDFYMSYDYFNTLALGAYVIRKA